MFRFVPRPQKKNDSHIRTPSELNSEVGALKDIILEGCKLIQGKENNHDRAIASMISRGVITDANKAQKDIEADFDYWCLTFRRELNVLEPSELSAHDFESYKHQLIKEHRDAMRRRDRL